MIIEHQGKKPKIHESAYIAPNATISGDVTIEEDVRILFGAVVSEEGSPVVIKKGSVIMENAVLKSGGGKRQQFPLHIGEHVLIGPHTYLSGCTVEDGSFIAAGAKVYNGAHVGTGSIIAIGGIVHVNCKLPDQSRVSIYNVAFGSPAKIYAPNQVTEIGMHLQELDFLGTVFGMGNSDDFPTRLTSAIEKYSNHLKTHQNDRVVSFKPCN